MGESNTVVSAYIGTYNSIAHTYRYMGNTPQLEQCSYFSKAANSKQIQYN